MTRELPVRVLIAEDEPVARVRLIRVLESWGYQVSVAEDGDEAWRLLQLPDAPSLAIVDWMMPGLDGTEICRRVKADPEGRQPYVIMLTANKATADIVTAMDAGADDFVAKPFEFEELRVRLRAGQRIVSLQLELRRKASHDHVTGIFNRGVVLEMLRRERARAARQHSPVAVAVLDLDRFKRVNDVFGHQAGDIVLHEAARRISASLRRIDIVGRYGGEEFLLVMPGCGSDAAVMIAERVRFAIAATPMLASDRTIPVTASIGVATMAETSQNDQQLIAEADSAMYEAKRRGRNRVEVAPVAVPEGDRSST